MPKPLIKYELDESQLLEINFDDRDTSKSGIAYLILHYTVGTFDNTIATFHNPENKVSSHYLVPDFSDQKYIEKYGTAPRVFKLVDESKRAWHAGLSAWEKDQGLNHTSIGIEITNKLFPQELRPAFENGANNSQIFGKNIDPEVWPKFDEITIEIVKALCANIMSRNPDITQFHVLGHSDIAIGTISPTNPAKTVNLRKFDPGYNFPWQDLSESGSGIWYDQKSLRDQASPSPSVSEVKEKLTQYGYHLNSEGDALDESTTTCLKVFQLHFRPQDTSGIIDHETTAILWDLVKQKEALLTRNP